MDARSLSDRELRALSTADLLSLIRQDIAELDQISKQRHERKAAEMVIRPVLHNVTCCGVHMGDFLPIARVRCPFCGQWHHAGAFPQANVR